MSRPAPRRGIVAPFSLRLDGPLSAHNARERLKENFLASGRECLTGATLDPTPCPTCASPVEWAWTKKVTGKEQIPYVYARCITSPKDHRWDFKNAGGAPVKAPPEIPALDALANLAACSPGCDRSLHCKACSFTFHAAGIDALIHHAQREHGIEVLKAHNGPVYHAPTPKSPPIPLPPAPTPTPEKNTPMSEIPANPFAVFEAWFDAKIAALKLAPNAFVGGAPQEPRALEIRTPVAILKVNGIRHPVLDELLERYALGQRTFLLVGPAGTGKTTIAIQFARAIGALRHSVIAMSEQAREETIRGYRNAITNNYVPSAVVEDLCEALTGPTVTTLEEIDASNANTLLLVNTLDNGFLSTPDSDLPECPRSANHVLIATANTFGHAGSNVYVGRNQLDAATLNRYATLFVDYDSNLEKAIVGSDEICTVASEIRTKATAAGIRKVFSTRDAVRIRFDQRLEKNKTQSLRTVVREYLKNTGWVDTEIARVLS